MVPAPPKKEEPSAEPSQPTEQPKIDAPATDADAKLPFHEHPRWKEVLSQRNEFEAKVRDYESRATQQEPLVKAQLSTNQYCREHGITQRQFVELLNVQALINENPTAAFARLKPVYEQLAALNGQAPTLDADLQDLVTKGEIGQPQAQAWQKDRALNKFQEGRQRLTQEQQQAATDWAIEQEVGKWDMEMRVKDTAFKPRGRDRLETEPMNKYEITNELFGAAWKIKQPTTTFEALQMVRDAYARATAIVAASIPKPPPSGKPLPPNGSSAATRFEPKSLQDVVFGVADGSYQYER